MLLCVRLGGWSPCFSRSLSVRLGNHLLCEKRYSLTVSRSVPNVTAQQLSLPTIVTAVFLHSIITRAFLLRNVLVFHQRTGTVIPRVIHTPCTSERTVRYTIFINAALLLVQWPRTLFLLFLCLCLLLRLLITCWQIFNVLRLFISQPIVIKLRILSTIAQCRIFKFPSPTATRCCCCDVIWWHYGVNWASELDACTGPRFWQWEFTC